ncbi:subtilisin-like serine protease [Burkholderiales bacterium JOSHI_001]|nr:subtilisin-like serine protease [Burkholderiales bacterium JOSHI_001]
MRTLTTRLGALLLLAGLVLATSAQAQALETARVIVKFRADAGVSRQALGEQGAVAVQRPQHARRLMRRVDLADLSLADGRVVAPRVQVLRARGTSTRALLARLRANPDVEYAEEDQRVHIAAVPNDPLFAGNQPTGVTPSVGQWYLRANGGEVVSAINAQAAWDIATGAGVVVAVIDTGVRPEHPDLQGKLLTGYDFVSTASDNDARSGRDPDPTDPGDWTAFGECSTRSAASDSSWHGTQVAGLVAASSNNGVGISGTALDAKVLPVRALGKCGGFQSDIVSAMRWAAGLDPLDANVPRNTANPAKVINLSLGSSGACSATYQTAVSELTAAGVVVVAAAGNGAGLAALQPSNCVGVIGVAGVRHAGTKVGYSNLGPNLSVAAPAGNCVNTAAGLPCLYPLATTTNSGSTTAAANTYSDSFDTSLGTSFASPLVAGTVAMMLQANSRLTPAQVRALIRSSARAFPPASTDASVPQCTAPSLTEQVECHCTTTTCGAGMLDALAAVQAATGGFVAPTVTASASPNQPEVGGTISLSSTFVAPAGRSITAFQWVLTSGADIAVLSGETTPNAATIVASAAGTITAQLTVTDSQGAQASASVTVTVVDPATTAAASGGGASGGGALGWPWLAGLALAVAALPRRRRA